MSIKTISRGPRLDSGVVLSILATDISGAFPLPASVKWLVPFDAGMGFFLPHSSSDYRIKYRLWLAELTARAKRQISKALMPAENGFVSTLSWQYAPFDPK
jgi:hypothetical protein